MKEILTVTVLNENIKNLLEECFDTLWVEGEISNLRKPASGHIYFTLKDEKSQIRAVVFKTFGRAGSFPPTRRPGFDLEEGMSVICCARLSVYQARGEYQLIVEAVEPKGIGALQIAFEQLKARLQAEGLFDAARKKPIPFLPHRIGVITSPTGAVIRDILNITARRFPSVDILIAPVRVQGPEAPGEIIRALSNMQAVGDVDVVIIARGGGSLEDLAPFNDEGVARAVYQSQIPVISAIGHEIDFTITDFVADLRAPTPSAAAELVVPVKRDLAGLLARLHEGMIARQRSMVEDLNDRLSDLRDRLKDPGRRIDDLRLMVDDRMERLRSALIRRLAMLRPAVAHLDMRLQHASPMVAIQKHRDAVRQHERSMCAEWERMIQQLRNRVQSDMAILDSLSPLTVLRRGYSIVTKLPEGVIVRDAGSVAVDSEVAIRVSAGSLQAKVTKICQE